MTIRSPLNLTSFALLSLAACAIDPPDPSIHSTDPTGAGGAGAPGIDTTVGATGPSGLHAVGNHIEDANGQTVVLRGVNRSGTEYMCIQGRGIFDGPSDESSIAAIASWKVNSVRVPLNETCWLGINGAPAGFAGQTYRTAIQRYVALLRRHALVPIIELHWVAPGTLSATRQQPMPDADHSPVMWEDVARTFGNDDGIVFEPYNEPYPDGNRDSAAAWQCWRDGCTANLGVATGMPAMTYSAAGMQALVSAIRDTGAHNLILLGGVQYANTLSQWLASKPMDPMDNLGAAWHAYSFNACNSAACWDVVPATVSATVPLVATEFGQRDCQATFVTPIMQWLDVHTSGYLAWSWNAFGACAPYVSRTQPGQPWSLVGDYGGRPNGGYAQAVHDHLVGF